MLARPLCTVEHAATDAGLSRLVELVRSEEADRVVVGLPLTLRGEQGAQAEETMRVRRPVALGRRRAGRDLRRALHDDARRSRGGRRRPRRGPPPVRLPRVVEGPELNRPTRQEIYRRRVVALVVVLAVFGVCAWAAYAVVAGTTAARRLRRRPPSRRPSSSASRSPRGLSTREMARVAGRRSPADHPARLPPRRPDARLPPVSATTRRRPRDSCSRTRTSCSLPILRPPLVEKQLENFRAKWSRVDLGYARSKNLTRTTC